jgi:hypothetical protein
MVPNLFLGAWCVSAENASKLLFHLGKVCRQSLGIRVAPASGDESLTQTHVGRICPAETNWQKGSHGEDV